MGYFTYISHSISIDNYYVGMSSDLEERLRKHNSNHKGFTGKANDWAVVYKQLFELKANAFKHERQIKKMEIED